MSAQWLVRTSNNFITGPYSREQVVGLIQEGKLTLQDEVCAANGYWIFLHEHQEVEGQLGIRMPRNGGDDDEVTETETLALDRSPHAPVPLEELPEEGASPEQGDGMTTVSMMSRQAHSEPRHAEPVALPAASPRVSTQGVSLAQIEKPSIWRGFTWLLVVGACVILVAVLRILRSAGA